MLKPVINEKQKTLNYEIPTHTKRAIHSTFDWDCQHEVVSINRMIYRVLTLPEGVMEDTKQIFNVARLDELTSQTT